MMQSNEYISAYDDYNDYQQQNVVFDWHTNNVNPGACDY